MGSIPCCGDCSQVHTDEIQVRSDELKMERIQAARKLFDLMDLNGDGQITVDEFVIMGLNQTKVHKEKPLTTAEEESVKEVLVQKFSCEIDPDFTPMTYAKYKEYILRSVNNMDPGDMEACGILMNFIHIFSTSHVQSFSYSHTATPKRDSWRQPFRTALAAKSERLRAFPKQTTCVHQVCTSLPTLKHIALCNNQHSFIRPGPVMRIPRPGTVLDL